MTVLFWIEAGCVLFLVFGGAITYYGDYYYQAAERMKSLRLIDQIEQPRLRLRAKIVDIVRGYHDNRIGRGFVVILVSDVPIPVTERFAEAKQPGYRPDEQRQP